MIVSNYRSQKIMRSNRQCNEVKLINEGLLACLLLINQRSNFLGQGKCVKPNYILFLNQWCIYSEQLLFIFDWLSNYQPVHLFLLS